MSWPADSLFGYRSLQIHDSLYGTKYFETFARFKQTMLRIQDRATGLMPAFVHLDGSPRDVPRGCALSWSLAVLPQPRSGPAPACMNGPCGVVAKSLSAQKLILTA